ncbi:MAG: hypothetical protein ACHQJ4_07405 [Ignavibacteria bacterium]
MSLDNQTLAEEAVVNYVKSSFRARDIQILKSEEGVRNWFVKLSYFVGYDFKNVMVEINKETENIVEIKDI